MLLSMDPDLTYPVASPVMTYTRFFWECFHELGIFGLFFFVTVIVLVAGLFILLFKQRPLSEYFIYLAATLYPFLLGFLGGAFILYQLIYDWGTRGIADPARMSGPSLIVNDLSQLLVRLICGSLLTCIFFPLGLVLLIRRPK